MMTKRVAESIYVVSRGDIEDALSALGKGQLGKQTSNGYEIKDEPGAVTGTYSLRDMQMAVQIRADSSRSEGNEAPTIVTLVDDAGTFVAGILGPTRVDYSGSGKSSGYSYKRLEDMVARSMLTATADEFWKTTELRATPEFASNPRIMGAERMIFLSAAQARSNVQVINSEIRKERLANSVYRNIQKR